MTDDRMPDRTDSAIRALVIELIDATPPPPSWESIRAQLEAREGGTVTTIPVTDPEASPPATPDDDLADLPTYTRHEERRTARWRPIAAATGAVGALVGGAFAYAAFNGPDGASSPEAAVEQFVEALSDEDLIGVLESLPPSEREVLTETARDAAAEAQRLGLTAGLDTSDVAGFDFEVEGLTLRTERLGEGVTAVHVDGRLVSRATGTELPLGEAVLDAITDDDTLGKFEEDVAQLERIFDEQDVFVVAVEEDGGWHTSAWYTVAEYLRRDQEQPLPAFGQAAVPAVGADSPEQAVERFYQASLELDVTTALGLLAPDESRVLHDYGPLWFDEVAESREADGVSAATIERLDLQVDGDGDTRTVHLTGAAYTFTSPDGSRHHVDFDQECARFEGTPGDDSHFEAYDDEMCVDDLVDEGMEPWEWQAGYGADYVAVRHDGRWFLSPARSAAASVLSAARQVPDGTFTTEAIDRGAPLGLLFRFTNVLGGYGWGIRTPVVVSGEAEECVMTQLPDGSASTICEAVTPEVADVVPAEEAPGPTP